MSEQTHHEPAYLLETEALINRPAFEEPHLESTLRYQGVESLPDIVTEPREVLYVSALRVLATARRDERPGQLKPETRATWNEDWSHALTRKKAREIAEQSPASVYSIHDALASLQKSEHLEQNHRAIYDGLRAHQQPYMQGIADFMKEPPIIHDITNSKGETRTYIMRGATVEAPTGAGKTALIGRTAVAAGIGETFIDEQQQERARRMLVVVPSRALVRQFTGKAGDDTFRRFAPGLSVGGYYSSEKTTDTDVVVMTVEKFVDEVRNNQLDGQTFDLLAIDEAHHLLAPQFLDTVLEQWTKPIIGFTATPERSELRDIRDILPTTIKHADTLSYILEGVLNGAQLFLMRVDPNYDSNKLSNLDLVADKEQIKGIKQETINKAVVDFVRPLLEQGRRRYYLL